MPLSLLSSPFQSKNYKKMWDHHNTNNVILTIHFIYLLYLASLKQTVVWGSLHQEWIYHLRRKQHSKGHMTWCKTNVFLSRVDS